MLVGGSGLIGGALMHYFKTKTDESIDVLSPNSKKLSLREPDDILGYCRKYRPDFIVNTAIAAIDADAQLAYEVNYLGTVSDTSLYFVQVGLADVFGHRSQDEFRRNCHRCP